MPLQGMGESCAILGCSISVPCDPTAGLAPSDFAMDAAHGWAAGRELLTPSLHTELLQGR